MSKTARRIFISIVAATAISVMTTGCSKSSDPPATSASMDILFVLDCSYSMQEGTIDSPGYDGILETFTYFEVMKRTAEDMIKHRSNDRIGILGFAHQSVRTCPLTTNHELVIEKLNGMKMDLGTGIGSALQDAASILEQDPKGSRSIIVLISDGQSNLGTDALQAAKDAKAKGIAIYTLKITKVSSLRPTEIAAQSLYKLAKASAGRYYEVTQYETPLNLLELIDSIDTAQ